MVLYYNTVRQNKKNVKYLYRKEINCVEDLEQVVQYDHVGASYKDNYRKNSNFLSADCSMFDVDNTDSDNPDQWITPDAVQETFPDVPFYVSYSRNHMKQKGDDSPRPKFHVYFPDITYSTMEEYRQLKAKICRYFPAFDSQAKDAARFFFGVEIPQVKYYPGNRLLSKFLETVTISKNSKTEQVGKHKADQADIILEGKRNTTMFHFAEHILRKKGDTQEAYQAYMDESKKCSPPLPQNELMTTWKSAQKRYHNAVQNSTDENTAKSAWGLLDLSDQSAMKELFDREPKERKFSITIARLFLQAFGIRVRLNEMNRRTEISGLPPQYSGEDAHNLLVTLISDFMSLMSYRRATGPVVYDALNVIANENRYHPVLELLDDEPWDGTDRLPDICHMMGVTDDFHKTLVKKWALQTITVLYNSEKNRIAAQGVLVLQGEQGIGKTQFFRHLAIREEFFKGGATLDMSNKDSLMSATKVWICELGEIDSTTKKEQSALKAFLTEQIDRFREPYARAETIRPRRTSFCGTVNPTRYLRDETGNRRYWTIPIKSVDIDAVVNHSPNWYAQFWRQMHEAYKRNPKGYLLTRQEQDRVNQCNSDFEAELHGEDEFMTLFDTIADISVWQWRTAADIAKILNANYKGLNITSASLGRQLIPRLQRRIGKGFARKTVKGNRLIQVPPVCVQNCYDSSPNMPPTVSFGGAGNVECALDDNVEEDVTF